MGPTPKVFKCTKGRKALKPHEVYIKRFQRPLSECPLRTVHQLHVPTPHLQVHYLCRVNTDIEGDPPSNLRLPLKKETIANNNSGHLSTSKYFYLYKLHFENPTL